MDNPEDAEKPELENPEAEVMLAIASENEGFREFGIGVAGKLIRGEGIDSVFSDVLKYTFDTCVEKIVDPIVEKTRRKLQENADPISVPGTNFGFEQLIFCLPLDGQAQLEEGNIKNLSSIARSDEDCSMTHLGGGIISVKLKLKLSQLCYETKGALDFLCAANSLFILKGLIAAITCSVELQVSCASFSKLSVSLANFDFSVDGFDVDIEGDGLVPFFANAVKNSYMKENPDLLKDLCVDNVKRCLKSVVAMFEREP